MHRFSNNLRDAVYAELREQADRRSLGFHPLQECASLDPPDLSPYASLEAAPHSYNDYLPVLGSQRKALQERLATHYARVYREGLIRIEATYLKPLPSTATN